MEIAVKPSRPLAGTGLTALDLLVSMAIAAVLVTVAVPAYRHHVFEQRMKAAVGQLHADLALARNEAIGRATRIVACPAAPAAPCLDRPHWHAGWLLFADTNGDREWQPGEPVLRRGPAHPLLDITSSAHRMRLRFFANGSAPGSNARITFCDARGAAAARQIVLSASGRIRRLSGAESGPVACGA